jgi:putative nucleotidyltransferase with HDIG domain
MSSVPDFETSVGTKSVQESCDKIQALVDKVNLSAISSIKQSVSAILRTINDERSTVGELKEVIQLDPPLSAGVLKTANSAYYSRSFSRTFADIEQAIIWIGTETIKELALSIKVCEIFDRDEKIERYSRRALWRHCIAVALMSKFIYRREFGLKGENAYAAGILHDLGIIAEDQFLQDNFKRALLLSDSEKIDLTTAEHKVLGFEHSEIGGAIAASWGLPKELCRAIEFHHRPLEAPPEFSRIACVLYISDTYCRARGFYIGAELIQDEPKFNECLEVLNIRNYALDIIFKNVDEEIKKMDNKNLI